jgi:hypothetical protein
MSVPASQNGSLGGICWNVPGEGTALEAGERLSIRIRVCLHRLRKNSEIGDWSLEGARLQAAPYIISKELRHG